MTYEFFMWVFITYLVVGVLIGELYGLDLRRGRRTKNSDSHSRGTYLVLVFFWFPILLVVLLGRLFQRS